MNIDKSTDKRISKHPPFLFRYLEFFVHVIHVHDFVFGIIEHLIWLRFSVRVERFPSLIIRVLRVKYPPQLFKFIRFVIRELGSFVDSFLIIACFCILLLWYCCMIDFKERSPMLDLVPLIAYHNMSFCQDQHFW